MANPTRIPVYVSSATGADTSWLQGLRQIQPVGGGGLQILPRTELAGNWQPIQAAIGQSRLVIVDFSPGPNTGQYADPDVVTEATLARFGLSPKPVIVLHSQRFEQLPTTWRLLHGDASVRFAPISSGLDPIKQHLASWIGELAGKPMTASYPFRKPSDPPEIFVTQSFQRGDGTQGSGGFDFAKFFQAVKASVERLGWPTPIRIAAVPKERDPEAVWTKIHGGLSRCALVVAECSPDGKSGRCTTPDVVTEVALARYRYQVPLLIAAHSGSALPQDWADVHQSAIRYDRNNLPNLVEQLAGRIRQSLTAAPVSMATLETMPLAMMPVTTSEKAAPEPKTVTKPQSPGPKPVSQPFIPNAQGIVNEAVSNDSRPFGAVQSAASRATAQARQHFERFQQALAQRAWTDAAREYVAAVRLDPYQHACFNPDRFICKDVLGAGPTGCVFHCVAQPTEDFPAAFDVALKVILWPNVLGQDPDQLFNNLDLLRQVPRKSVLSILGWDRYPRGEASAFWHFWSPYYRDATSLDRLIDRRGLLPEEDVRDIAIQLVQGLQAIHLYHLPHLALRPSNVLVRKREGKPGYDVWVRDVGFTPDFTQPFPPEAAWAHSVMDFAAPEQKREMPMTPGQVSDIYSLGLVLLYAIAGSPVIDIDTLEKLDALKLKGLRDVVQGCIKHDPRQRYQSLAPVLMMLDSAATSASVSQSPTLRLTTPGGTRPVTALMSAREKGMRDSDVFGGLTRAEVPDLPDDTAIDAASVPEAPAAELVAIQTRGLIYALRGATREEGPLRERASLQTYSLAPELLFPEDPLPPRKHPAPTHELGGPRPLIVGIDLGTCNSTLGYIDENGDTKVVSHAQSTVVTPSAVYFPKPFVAEVGQDAKQMAVFDPLNTAQFMKLVMGDSRRSRPFHGTKFSPEMISALILRYLVEHAVEELGGPDEVAIKDVVVTVPSSWDDVRRQATALAIELAGLKPLAILSEPVAVALETSLKSLREGKTVLVYDFGGGTFDCTIYRLDENVVRILANLGLPTLGGTHLDQKVADHIRGQFRDEFAAENPPDPMDRPQTKWELLTRCEEVKMALCKGAPPQMVSVTCGGFTGKYQLDRETLEKIIQSEIDTTMQFVMGALLEAQIKANQVDLVIAVGGSSQIPLVRRKLAEMFGEEKLVGRAVNPQETVARGATRNAADIWVDAVKRGAVPESRLPVGMRNKLGDAPVLREETTQALSVIVLDPENGEEHIEVVIPQGTPWPARGAIFVRTFEDHQMNVICRIRSGSSYDPDGTERLGTVSFPLIPGVPKGCPLKLEFWFDGPERLHAALWDGASGEVQQLMVPWPGPQERQIDTWRQVVSECQIVLD